MRYILLIAAIGFAGSASSQDSADHVLYVCDQQTNSVTLSVVTNETEKQFEVQKKLGRTAERINFKDLIEQTRDEQGEVRQRTGSDVARRTCGSFKVSIQGGFLNANPNGELGALEFPLVAIELDAQQRSSAISLGICEKSNARYNYSTECPDNWAVSVQASLMTFGGKSEAVFTLDHSYTEVRSTPP